MKMTIVHIVATKHNAPYAVIIPYQKPESICVPRPSPKRSLRGCWENANGTAANPTGTTISGITAMHAQPN